MYSLRVLFRRLLRGLNAVRLVSLNVIFFLLLFLFFKVLVGDRSRRPSQKVVQSGTVLLMRPVGVVTEQRPRVNLGTVFLNPKGSAILLSDITQALRNAATDRRIESVFFDLSNMSGWTSGHFVEMESALSEYKKSKKPLYVFSTSYSLADYYIASFADEIILDPMGSVDLSGFYTETLFYGGMEEKIGVRWNVVHAGVYKGMAEIFSRKDFSPEVRRNYQSVFARLWQQYLSDVSRNRALEVQHLARYADRRLELLQKYNGDGARTALAEKLVTRVCSYDEAGVALKFLKEDDYESAKNFVGLDDYNRDRAQRQVQDQVGIIHLAGPIAAHRDTELGGTISDEVSALLDVAMSDPDIKAVVLRIDSGGGEVFASERIRRALARAKRRGKKPVIVSMGAIAASGAYWVASAADYIFASPYTITGSIGVLSVLPTFETFLERYAGITVDSVQVHGVRQPSLLRSGKAEDTARMQLDVMATYRTFLSVVSAGRNLTLDRVAAVAEGRIYAGEDAVSLGLVDALGGLDEAVAHAAKESHCRQYSVRVLKRSATYGEEFLQSLWDVLQKRSLAFGERVIIGELLQLDLSKGTYVYEPLRLHWR